MVATCGGVMERGKRLGSRVSYGGTTGREEAASSVELKASVIKTFRA